MNDHDALLFERFSGQHDPLPEPDFADVRRRARTVAGPAVPTRRLWLQPPRRRVLVAVVTAAAAITAVAAALGYRYLGPSPGLTSGVGSLHQLPSSGTLPSSATAGLDRMAAYAGISVAQAKQRMRLLQHGRPQGDLYAFEGSDGTVCLLVTDHAGNCLKNVRTDAPGVMAMISGGYPGESSALVAVVADNVRAVRLVADGRSRDVPIVNNSIYADLSRESSADTIALEVRYGDGSIKTLNMPGPNGS
jgi:hypothetical protein